MEKDLYDFKGIGQEEDPSNEQISNWLHRILSCGNSFKTKTKYLRRLDRDLSTTSFRLQRKIKIRYPYRLSTEILFECLALQANYPAIKFVSGDQSFASLALAVEQAYIANANLCDPYQNSSLQDVLKGLKLINKILKNKWVNHHELFESIFNNLFSIGIKADVLNSRYHDQDNNDVLEEVKESFSILCNLVPNARRWAWCYERFQQQTPDKIEIKQSVFLSLISDDKFKNKVIAELVAKELNGNK